VITKEGGVSLTATDLMAAPVAFSNAAKMSYRECDFSKPYDFNTKKELTDFLTPSF
jgi:hypothetical protein